MTEPRPSHTNVRMRFRAVEYHTIVRDVPSDKIESFKNDAELFDWLHSEFSDDGMQDGEIETDEFELDHFETLPIPPTPAEPIDTFLEWLREKSKGVDFAQSFYLEVHHMHRNNDDDGESYCWECVNKQRWLNRHKRDPYTNIHRENWPDKDSSSFCDRCYTPLEHSPTNYHIESEIEHYANHANEPTSPTDALLLLNMMVMGAWESDKHWPGLAPVAAAMISYQPHTTP
jgi:hypothetical protein